MADFQHRNIPNSELHEPKGVSSASSGTVYVADGSGSGSWVTPKITGIGTAAEGKVYRADGLGGGSWEYPPQGWAVYKHSGATQVFGTTASKLVVNKLSTTTDEDFLPRAIRGSGTLWDEVTNKITPITVGDSYDVRLDLPVVSETGSVTDITIQLDIGGAATPTSTIVTRFASGGKNTPYLISLAFPFFTKGQFISNGGQIFIKTDAGSITVQEPQIYLERKSAGDF